MQVYEVKQLYNPDNLEPQFFRNFADIEASLKISYSALDVKISKKPTVGPVIFTVIGKFHDGSDLHHEFEAKRHPVWDSPTHM